MMTRSEWRKLTKENKISIHSKGNYHSDRHNLDIYIKHGPEYIPMIIETIKRHNPDIFIELGTFMGGLTLAIHEEFPELYIYSFDIKVEIDPKIMYIFNPERIEFFEKDLLTEESSTLLNILDMFGRKLLYCDNGKKAKEINMYSKYLNKDDVIGCHDWFSELEYEDVKDALVGFEPFCEKMWEESYLLSRFWIKE